MSYYWFNREELLKNAKTKYHKKVGKEKASKYYQDNKEVIIEKEKERNKYENLTKEEKGKRQYSRNQYKKLKQQYKG